jgi:sialic acid synthase SpsE
MSFASANIQPFTVAGRPIGPGRPPLFVPDIGTFFNRDTALAKEMIRQLHESKAEIVKGEILHDPNICLDDDTQEAYFSLGQGQAITERYRDLVERKCLPLSAYADIFGECQKLDLPFLVSVYDFAGADFARDLGAAALKIATSNIVHEPLIRHCAKIGLPLIIDTGRSTMAEIGRAIDWARDSGAKDVIVEHSPPPPPHPVDEQNLRAMQVFEYSFHCLVGLSDHHAGPEMLYAASALGADVIEKGICRDDNADDQDVAHALPISQFAEVNRICQMIYTGLGTGQLPPVTVKKKSRMCITSAQDLPAGAILTLETAGFAFPATGIPVEHWSMVEGWRLRRPVAKGQPITWADVEPLAS